MPIALDCGYNSLKVITDRFIFPVCLAIFKGSLVAWGGTPPQVDGGSTINVAGLWAQYRDELASDPFLVLALSAALIALATTPLAFAVLGRLGWFKARRGRVIQRPEFSSIVAGMLLVMGIPAIFAALVIKSRSFDRNRYEFDPNRTWSVLGPRERIPKPQGG